MTLSPAHLLIQYIELSSQSGNQLIQRLDGFGNVYLGQSFIPNEAEILEASITNQSTPFNIGNSMAAGASIVYVVPLRTSWFVQTVCSPKPTRCSQ